MPEQQALMVIERDGLQAPTPMDLLKIAMSKDVDVDKLTRLWELQVEWQKAMAQQAYNEAMTAFKANAPKVGKNKHVEFGFGDKKTAYDHATLDHATDVIGQALAAYGFSHKWSMAQSDGSIRVKCTIRHKQGHEESVELAALADVSGSKNGIQAIGSTVTYLQRYTLFAATGLAPQNGDDDAQSGTGLDDLSERLEFIANCRNPEELKRIYAIHYKAAAAAKSKRAMTSIKEAYDAKKQEFAA